MTIRKLVILFSLAILLVPTGLLARQSILLNGSMEFGPGPISTDPHIPAGWVTFGPTVERSDEANYVPSGAGHALKAFSSDPQVGAYQDVACTPGQNVTISAYLYTRAGDKLSGDAQAWIALEFYKADHASQIGFYPLSVLNQNSSADTWVPGTIGPIAAPALTAFARMTCVWTWNGTATGSAYWDSCSLTIAGVNGGANLLVNGDFETAGQSQQSPFGIDDWAGFNDQEQSGDFAMDGTKSVKIGTSFAWNGLYQNMIALDAGDHVYLQAYVLNPSSDPLVGASPAGIKLEFDPNGVVPPPVENLPFNQDTPVNTWTQVTLSTPVPTGITVARVTCIFAGTQTTTGAVHFDSVSAKRSSSPTVNQLANPSFESGPGGPNGLANWTEFNTASASEAVKSCFEVSLDGDCTCRATGTNYAGVYQEIAVAPGETLNVAAYLYTPDYDDLQSGTAGVKVEWFYGGVPSDIDIGGSNNTIYAGAATDTWLPLYIDYTMPTGSNALARFVNIVGSEGSLTGSAYFDACEAVILNKFDGSDADADNDEDLLDYAQFQRAVNGSGSLKWNSLVFDYNDDGHVNSTDFNYFAPRMVGPHQ